MQIRIVKNFIYKGRFTNAAGPENNVLHPQKGITIWDFLTYQAFKSREGIISRKIHTERLKIGIL